MGVEWVEGERSWRGVGGGGAGAEEALVTGMVKRTWVGGGTVQGVRKGSWRGGGGRGAGAEEELGGALAAPNGTWLPNECPGRPKSHN